MKEMLKLGIILSAIYIIAGISLSGLDTITKPIIEERNTVANNEARKAVLSEAKEFELVDGVTSEEVVEVWAGKSGDEVIGYTVKTTPKGYGGKIEVIIGISSDGIIKGINIGNHSETPGLGSKSEDPQFKDQFIDKSTESLINVVKGKASSDNEIAAISGATITSNAVTKGVNSAISIYNDKLANK